MAQKRLKLDRKLDEGDRMGASPISNITYGHVPFTPSSIFIIFYSLEPEIGEKGKEIQTKEHYYINHH